MRLGMVGLWCAALIGTSSIARADQITAGQVVEGFPGSFTVIGNGFDISGNVSDENIGCTPCQGGQAVALSLTPDIRSLSGTVNGVNYPSLTTGSATTRGSLLNLFSVGPVAIPFNGTTGSEVTFPFVTAPNDELVGFAQGGDTAVPVFDIPVTGSGTATLLLHLDGTLPNGTPIFTGHATWTFGSSASPTPEPASLLLLGTGLIGLVVRRRIV